MNTLPIRLLHIIWEGLGGSERGVADLTRTLNPEKYEITVAILSKGGINTDAIDRKRIRLEEFSFSSGLDIPAFLGFWKFLRSNQFDIVVNHERTFLVNAALLAKLPGTPLVYHEHGMRLLNGSLGERLFYLIWSRIYEILIALNEDTAERMMRAGRLPPKKLAIVENPVDTEAFSPVTSQGTLQLNKGGQLTVGTVARLVPEKDVELFIESAGVIARHHNNVVFIVVGDGPLREKLEAKAAILGLKDKITFRGGASDVPRFLRTFDIFMFTSRYEAFGRTLIEALACEVPVIAAEPLAGGARDLLRKLPGVLVTESRTPQRLASETIHLLSDPATRESMGKRGRDYIVEQYDVKRWSSIMDSLYAGLLDRRRDESDDSAA
jgi:glycosyltransferase involved in cell wall biosynthesis